MNYSNMSVTISFSLYTLIETDELVGKLGVRKEWGEKLKKKKNKVLD